MKINLSWAHIHLLFNHFPIVGAIFGLLLLAYALFKNSEDLKRASYWLAVIIGAIAVVVYISGTQAVGAVIELPRVSEAYIHQHRQIAEWSFIALEVLAAMGLIGLLLSYRKKHSPNWFASTTLLVAIIATGLVSWAGLQGGIIRHTEVRGDLPFLAPAESESGGEHGHTETGGHDQSGTE